MSKEPEVVEIPLVDLLLDQRNARLAEEQASQQSTIAALAEQQGKQLVELASDIVDKRMLDPTSFPVVVPTDDQRKRYLVLEGNRRILALKSLETPSLVSGALRPAEQRKLNALAGQFADNRIEVVRCVLFDEEGDALHWINLRHTGQNQGVGLVEWGREEKDRWASRHGLRSRELQILEFVEKHGSLSEAARRSKKGVVTSLGRLINTPEVRARLGIDIVDDQVVSHFPTKEVAKSLSRIVEDLKTGRKRVGDIYYVQQRRTYAEELPAADLPDESRRLKKGVLLDGLTKGEKVDTPEPRKRRRRRRTPPAERTAVIPRDCLLEIKPPRINTIYMELSTLSVDQYPNACSVMVRVMLELSVDHYLSDGEIMGEADRRNAPLAKRLKAAIDHLEKSGKVAKQLHTAIHRVADSTFVVAASTVTFNQYVHNRYVFPKASELRVAWDELQPFMEAIWT